MNNHINPRVMFKFMLSGFLLLVLSFGINAQSIIIVNQLEPGNQSHDHCAGVLVHLQPGYSYTPSTTQTMHSYISAACADEIRPYYAGLKKKMDGGIYSVTDDRIYLKYREEYNTNEFRFSIYNYDNSLFFDQSNITISTVSSYGDNRIEIPLAGIPAGYYMLEVVNDKNEKWYLRFKY